MKEWTKDFVVIPMRYRQLFILVLNAYALFCLSPLAGSSLHRLRRARKRTGKSKDYLLQKYFVMCPFEPRPFLLHSPSFLVLIPITVNLSCLIKMGALDIIIFQCTCTHILVFRTHNSCIYATSINRRHVESYRWLIWILFICATDSYHLRLL